MEKSKKMRDVIYERSVKTSRHFELIVIKIAWKLWRLITGWSWVWITLKQNGNVLYVPRPYQGWKSILKNTIVWNITFFSFSNWSIFFPAAYTLPPLAPPTSGLGFGGSFDLGFPGSGLINTVFTVVFALVGISMLIQVKNKNFIYSELIDLFQII